MDEPSSGGIAQASPETSSAGHGRFPALDGLRGLAAVSILIYHASFDTGSVIPGGFGIEILNQVRLPELLDRMDVGVAVFFVLSGFLLYRPFALAHHRGSDASPTTLYLRKRLLRIVPAYWVGLGLIVVLFPLSLSGPRDYVTYFGFAQIYDARRALGGLPQAWTLCVEMSFYVTLPLYAWCIARATKSRRSAWLRWELGGVGILVATAIGYKVALYVLEPGWAPQGLLWLPAQLDRFAPGIALAIFSVHGTEGDRTTAQRVATWGRPLVLWWATAGITYWVVATQLDLPWHLREKIPGGNGLARDFCYLFIGLVLIAPLVLAPHQDSLMRRVLASRPLHLLGLVSYSFYIWHKSLLEWTRRSITGDLVPGELSFHGNLAITLLIAFAITMVVSTLSYFLVERPATRYKK